jgi:hypothetical protein
MVLGKRITSIVALVAAMSLVGVYEAKAAPIDPIRVLGGRTDQFGPGASTTYIGYTANTLGSPDHYDAYVKATSGGSVTKLNSGSQGAFGGILPDGSQAVYQQFNNRGSDIHLVDLPAFSQVFPGSGINTDNWEFLPVISQDWIMFGRITRRTELIKLFDRNTSEMITLSKVDLSGSKRLLPDNVTETYATWSICGSTSCNAVYYNLTTKQLGRVPNPNKSHFYAPSVSDTSGNIYFARSGNGCGVRVRIQSWDFNSLHGFTTVSSLPDGYDVAFRTFTFVDSGHDDVYFDRVRCSGKFYSDIFETPEAETA